MKHVLSLIVLQMTLHLTAYAEVTHFKADTDDQHHIEGHGYSTSGDTETFIIAAGCVSQSGTRLPAVQRFWLFC